MSTVSPLEAAVTAAAEKSNLSRHHHQRSKINNAGCSSQSSNVIIVVLSLLYLAASPSPVDGFFFRKDSSSSVEVFSPSSITVAGTNLTTTTATAETNDTNDTKITSSLRPSNLNNLLLKEEEEFQRRQQQKQQGSRRNEFDNDQDGGLAPEDLIFEGTFEYESDLLPLSASPQELLEFFLNPENRDLVIKGGGKPCTYIPATQELYDEWTANAHIVNSSPPDGKTQEQILAVESDVHLVPGLSISAVSYTGAKVMTNPATSLPFYEFTLVKESYQGKGTRPMVWIFDKITGNNHDPSSAEGLAAANDDNHRSKTYALSRVTIAPDRTKSNYLGHEHQQQRQCRIYYYGHVKVVSKLPKRLLHILPLPKKTVEDKVSKSIVSQLQKEGIESIDNFCRALQNWAQQHNHHKQQN